MFALGWLLEWIIIPCLLAFVMFLVLHLLSKRPLLGAILHIAIAVFAYVSLGLLDYPETVITIAQIVIILAIVESINELRIACTYKIFRADGLLKIKYKTCAIAPAVGVAACYFIPGQSVFNSLVLILAVAPRVFFLFTGVTAAIMYQTRAKKLIKSNDFFKVSGKRPRFGRGMHDYIKLRESKGLVVSNRSIINSEKSISVDKLEKTYPKSLIAKIAEKLASDKDQIKARIISEKELAKMSSKVSYISRRGYMAFCDNMEKILLNSGSLSPRTFIEKKFQEKSAYLLSHGVDYFLIKAFNAAVNEGRIVDEDKSDSPLVNHAYRHKQSIVQIKVNDANSDPRLSLDDG